MLGVANILKVIEAQDQILTVFHILVERPARVTSRRSEVLEFLASILPNTGFEHRRPNVKGSIAR